MTMAVVAVAALVVGTLLGYWFRGRAAQAERGLLEQSSRTASEGLAAAQSELAQTRAALEKERAAAAGAAAHQSVAEERERTIERLTAERDDVRGTLQREQQEAAAIARTQTGRIRELEALLTAEQKKTEEKIALLETAKQTLANQFQALAGEILEQKSKTFSEANLKELQPLRDQIKEFREKVEKAQADSNTGVTKLETLVNALNSMNQQISEDARNLTTALRGSAKTQGDWGEFILRDLLEKAGLHEGEQYSFQQSFAGVEGENGERGRTVRTDVIVYLPGGRNLVIDSKVSLTAYTDCVAAADDETRKSALKAHLASVRGHIAGLAKAGYHRLPGVEAPDFVVMFVPVEPAFLMALQNDAELWADAYKQNILLVGPTTLLYVIRIVHVLWQQERQARNVKDVMDRGTELYDKFVGFVADMEAIGDSLRKTDASYTNAMKKLSEGRGNLVRQVEMLKQLGIRSTKALPKGLLDRADADEPLLELAANAEDAGAND